MSATSPHAGYAGSQAPADIEIGLADLATIYMGAHRASQLARASRITEARTGALAELNAAFDTDRATCCGTVV